MEVVMHWSYGVFAQLLERRGEVRSPFHLSLFRKLLWATKRGITDKNLNTVLYLYM
jgi:hypothetical protein